MGCDYCDSIKGIGPHRALQLIKQHGSIEKILENLDTAKYTIPENWPYQEARRLFVSPEVEADEEVIKTELKWTDPDEEEIVKFLAGSKGFRYQFFTIIRLYSFISTFSEDRVRAGVKKLIKSKGTAVQSRLTSFFKSAGTIGNKKRKEQEDQENKKTSKKKSSSSSSRK